jgi:hypothetical protein
VVAGGLLEEPQDRQGVEDVDDVDQGRDGDGGPQEWKHDVPVALGRRRAVDVGGLKHVRRHGLQTREDRVGGERERDVDRDEHGDPERAGRVLRPRPGLLEDAGVDEQPIEEADVLL